MNIISTTTSPTPASILPTTSVIHSATAEEATHTNSLTPEQLTKNMGGLTKFYKWYAVGYFRNQEDTGIFKRWLDQRDYDLVPFETELSVAYRARRLGNYGE